MTELLVACSCICKTGQLWLVRPTVSGVLSILDFTIVLEAWTLNYCPAGSAAEFVVNLVAASHFFHFSSYLDFIYVYRGGYIVVTC